MKGIIALLFVALVASVTAKTLAEPERPIAIEPIVAPPEDEVAVQEEVDVDVEADLDVNVDVDAEVNVDVNVEEEEKVDVEVEEEEVLPPLRPNGCPVNPKINWLTFDELDCSKFYQCVWGGKVAMQCPEPLHFNRFLQICDWPWAAGCETALFPVPLPIPIERVIPKDA